MNSRVKATAVVGSVLLLAVLIVLTVTMVAAGPRWQDPGADLELTKTADDYSPNAGETVQFTLMVTNTGTLTATNVVLHDFLPAGVTVESVSPSTGSCTTGTPGDPLAPLTCNLGEMPAGRTNVVRVTVRIDPDYVQPTEPDDYRELENDALVSSDIFDPDNSDNRDHVILQVSAYSYLYGFKECPESVVAGEEMDYLIFVLNDGPSTVHNLSFVDALPEGVTFLDYEILRGGGTCSYFADEHAVTCYLGDVDPGQEREVRLRVRVAPDFDEIGLDNDIAWWDADSYFEFMPSWFDCGTEVEFLADLSIQKTSEPMKIYPGQQKVYHIEVTNHGPTAAPYVMVTDTLPLSVTYEIDNDNCDRVATDPDQLVCDLGSMMPGETKGFDVWALVSRDAPPGEITNEAHVFVGGEVIYHDPNEENNWAWATNLVLEPTVADLSLEKWWGEAPSEWFDGAPFAPDDCYPSEGVVRAGCPLTFSLTISNTGPLLAENVVVEDVMPAGVTVEGVGSSQGSCTTGIPGDPAAPLTCNLGNIPRDEGARIEVFVRTNADLAWEPLENDALVYSDIPDPDNGNNRSHVLIWVEPFSYLYLDKDGPPEIMAGEEIHYWINLRNEGPSTAHDVYLDDELPEGVSLLGAEVMMGQGSCPPGSALCSLGDIEPWGNRAVRVRGYVQPWLEGGSLITNTVRAWPHSPFYQPVPEEPISDTWETLVHSAADLSIWKTAHPWKVFAGEQVMYEVSVTNNGPSHAYGVLVTDTLPSGVAFELSTDPDCYPVDGQVICEWNMLGLGQTRSFQIFGRVRPEAEPGTVSNRVWVAADTWDRIDYNDYASAPTLIQGKADLKIRKFGKPDGLVRAGDKLTYTIIVDNLGTGYAHNVTLDDFITANGTFDLIEVTSDRPALCDPQTGTFQHDLHLTCALSDTLEVKGPAPGSGRWMITVIVIANQPMDINNIAYAASSDYDPDLSNNEAIAEHEITAVADLELTKEAWGEVPVGCDGETELWLDEVAAGGTVTYTLTVSNTGPSTAENVVVLDEPLPFADLLEIDVQSITPSQGSCQTANIVQQRRLSCNLGTILPEESASVTFVAHVPSWVPDYTVLVNDALVTSDMFDNNNGNDVVSNRTVVSRVADLMVEKTQDPELALPTMDITYTITVTNLGPSDVDGLFISDTMPVQVLNPTWTCCASDGGNCQVPCDLPVCPPGDCPWPDIGLWAQANIPAGEWAIYTIKGTLDVWPCGIPFTNTVTLLAPASLTHPLEDIDPCDDNNTDLTVNGPALCTFVPLALKSYPGPDSPP